MGTRIVTDAARLAFRGSHTAGYTGASTSRTGASGRSQSAISGNFRMSVIYDGTNGKQGLPAALDPNVAWMDPSGLYRVNSNFGPTFQNMGETVCVIAGCMAPRNYAYDPTAAMVTELAAKWEDLVTLNPTDVFQVGGKVFSLLRFTFTIDGAKGGAVECLSV